MQQVASCIGSCRNEVNNTCIEGDEKKKTVQKMNHYKTNGDRNEEDYNDTWHTKLCTIASKINVYPKGVSLPISKQHSILAAANLLNHN